MGLRVAPWLHPFLEALTKKVQKLRSSLETVNESVDQELVIAKACGRKVKKPIPSQQMSARAHGSIDRAIIASENHAQMLVNVLDDLRARSAPERLPQLVDTLGDACQQLQNVLFSSQFRARIGGNFPDLPGLGTGPTLSPTGASRVDPTPIGSLAQNGQLKAAANSTQGVRQDQVQLALQDLPKSSSVPGEGLGKPGNLDASGASQ